MEGLPKHGVVGRSGEWDCLEAWWRRLGAERSNVIVSIDGDPGIGKTTLAKAWCEHLHEKGAFVLAARADDFSRAALDPWRWALEDMTATTPFVGEAKQRALKQLCEAAPGPQEDSVASLIAELLAEASGGRPALVVLEDAHRADLASLEVFRDLALSAASPLMLVLTRRPMPALEAGIEQFLDHRIRSGLGHSIELSGLGAKAVDQLLKAQCEGLSDADADRVYASSEKIAHLGAGNPLYVKVLLGSFLESGTQQVLDGQPGEPPPHSWTPRARQLLLGRYVRPDSDAADFAGYLALSGRLLEREIPVVARASQRDPARARSALRDLVGSGALRTIAQGYEFSHPLLSEAFADLLSADQQRAFHLSLADCLAELTPDSDTLYTIAAHLAAADTGLSPGHVELLMNASMASMWTTPDTSAQWLKHVRGAANANDEQRLMAGMLELSCLLYAGRSQRGWQLARKLMADHSTGEAPAPLVDLAIPLAFTTANLVAAVEMADQAPSGSLSVDSLAAAATAQSFLGQGDQGLRRYLPVLKLTQANFAQDPTQVPISTVALVHLIGFAAMNGRTDELIELWDIARVTADRVSPVERAVIMASFDMNAYQHPTEMANKHESGSSEADGIRGGGMQLATLAVTDFLEGKWDTLVDQCEWRIDLLRSTGNYLAQSNPAATSALVYAERRLWGEAERLISLVSWPVNTFCAPFVALAEAKIHLGEDRPGKAIDTMKGAWERSCRSGIECFCTILSEQLVRSLLEEGAVERARAVAEEAIARLGSRRVPLFEAYAYLGRGRVTHDPRDLHRALDSARRARIPHAEALAEVLLANLGDEPQPRLHRAHEILIRLGASTERAACESEMRRAGVPTPRARGGSDLLTPVESSVVRELLAGKTNNEIADALYYSAKTIEMHLSRIYSRTGYKGRVELVRAVTDGDVKLSTN